MAAPKPREVSGTKGEGIDAAGGPVVDPSKNVLDLVQKSIDRLNDLREASEKLTDAKIAHIKELGELRSNCAHEVVQLRAEFADKIAEAEKDRVNAVRQTDQLNVTTTAIQAAAAIKALDATTTANADNIQKALTATAAAIAAQTAAATSAMTTRLETLEKALYTGQGKSTVSDPAMMELMGEMKRMNAIQTANTGQGQGQKAMWAAMAVIASLIVGVAAIFLKG